MRAIITLLTEYGLLVVFLNVLLEQIGFPLPAFPTLMTAAALVGRFDLAVFEIIGAGALGSILADLLWYRSGRRYGRGVLALLCKISLSPDSCVRQTETIFGKVGPPALLFSKFVPGVSNITVALAGVMRTPPVVFILLDGLGSLVFVTVPVMIGLVFKNALSDVLTTLSRLGAIGLAVVVVALAFYLAVRWWKRYTFIRQLRMDRITVDELVSLIGRGEKPLLLDVRPGNVRMSEGMIPGAVAAHPAELDPIVENYPRELEIVIYCSCPNEASAANAARHLKRAGFKRIRPLLGGLDAWSSAGHPLAISTPASNVADIDLALFESRAAMAARDQVARIANHRQGDCRALSEEPR